MKMKAVHFGALTLATPLPGWILTILWFWILCVGICLVENALLLAGMMYLGRY